jgi:L-asparaginase II
VQQKILAAISELCGSELTPAICGVDGCSAPNPAMPLENLARGFAAFMRQEKPAHRRIFQAMAQHPDLVGGTGRLDTALMQAAEGKIVSKTGAEGVYIAMIPELDTAIALKAEDGASRAAQAALYGLLEKHQLADSAVLDAIRPLTLPVLKNWRSIVTGKVVVL